MRLRATRTCRSVLLVDGDSDTRARMATLFGKNGLDVRCFDSAEAFLACHDTAQPGCLVTDVRLGEMSGLELQERLQSVDAIIGFVFVASSPTVADCARAMRMGAVDFLAKPWSDTALVERVSEALARINERRVDWVERQRTLGSYERLRPREKQVLHLLLESAGAKSNKDVARELDLSPRTIEQYRANIMHKMEAKSLTELLLRTSRALGHVTRTLH